MWTQYTSALAQCPSQGHQFPPLTAVPPFTFHIVPRILHPLEQFTGCSGSRMTGQSHCMIRFLLVCLLPSPSRLLAQCIQRKANIIQPYVQSTLCLTFCVQPYASIYCRIGMQETLSSPLHDLISARASLYPTLCKHYPTLCSTLCIQTLPTFAARSLCKQSYANIPTA